MLKKYKKSLAFLFLLAVIGQLIFSLAAWRYTVPFYENRIFATVGIQFEGSDLHKLNEGAHYFGQTMIGWTKFPHFKSELMENAQLPESLEINMHIQERQNIIFTLTTDTPITFEQLKAAKTFLQDKLDDYNDKTHTKFVLTNVDYNQTEVKRSYPFGALTVFILSVVLGMAILFVRKEFFNQASMKL
ncbi:hypothetical protein JW752_03240 [Candidatus Peregrinibacteria bacterium]|nr:hypothetical protein [Candidatus Peregrinibacteria bacterium]